MAAALGGEGMGRVEPARGREGGRGREVGASAMAMEAVPKAAAVMDLVVTARGEGEKAAAAEAMVVEVMGGGELVVAKEEESRVTEGGVRGWEVSEEEARVKVVVVMGVVVMATVGVEMVVEMVVQSTRTPSRAGGTETRDPQASKTRRVGEQGTARTPR